jgi:hypothetical protein
VSRETSRTQLSSNLHTSENGTVPATNEISKAQSSSGLVDSNNGKTTSAFQDAEKYNEPIGE